MDIKDLVDEVGYTPKWKAASHGGEYSSACPFCKDGDDRFLVWPERVNKNGEYHGGRYSCRVCQKYGDSITFLCELHGLSYPNACALLRLAPKNRASMEIRKLYKPPFAAPPPDAWIEKANHFVEWCHSKLMSRPRFLAEVCARGFSVESISRYKLGLNPGNDLGYDLRRERKEWALEEAFKGDGSPRMLWLPVGFTIPTFSEDGRVIKVKIRRISWKEGGKLPKYVELSGSKSCPSIYGDINLQTGLIVESEFDALLIQQNARDLLYCVALGGSTKPVDAETASLIKRTKRVLFLPDFDKAGAVAWSKWQKMFPSIKRILTPYEKSAGDYFLAGGNLREWFQGVLHNITEENKTHG